MILWENWTYGLGKNRSIEDRMKTKFGEIHYVQKYKHLGTPSIKEKENSFVIMMFSDLCVPVFWLWLKDEFYDKIVKLTTDMKKTNVS